MQPEVIPSKNPMQSVGLFVVYSYVFFLFARISEFMVMRLGSTLYLMPTMMGLALIATFLGGSPLRFLNPRLGGWYVGFFFWMFIGFPFSIWKGGSLPHIIVYLRMAVIFIVLLSLVRTIEQCRRIMVAIALSMLVIVVAGLTVDVSDTERLSLGGGSLSNPNELAFHILISLPFCIALSRARFKILQRLFILVILAGSVLILVKTGSRGSVVISLGMILLVFFFTRHKILIAVCSFVLLTAALAVAPQVALERYLTIFSSNRAGSVEAVESAQSRARLLKASVDVTLKNPIFGVGLGNFVVAYNNELFERGERHHWYVAHNAYTQISSEMGIPGLIFYIGCFVVAIRRLWRLRQGSRGIQELRAVHDLTSILLLSIFAYLAGGFFSSNAHQFYFPLLLGLAIALSEAGAAEVQRVRSQLAPAVPSMIPPPRFARPVPPLSPAPVRASKLTL